MWANSLKGERYLVYAWRCTSIQCSGFPEPPAAAVTGGTKAARNRITFPSCKSYTSRRHTSMSLGPIGRPLEHPSVMQPRDCGFVVTDLGQHLTRVLAEHRGAVANTTRGL